MVMDILHWEDEGRRSMYPYDTNTKGHDLTRGLLVTVKGHLYSLPCRQSQRRKYDTDIQPKPSACLWRVVHSSCCNLQVWEKGGKIWLPHSEIES